jgi:hypothetical protein
LPLADFQLPIDLIGNRQLEIGNLLRLCGKPDDPELNPIAVKSLNSHQNRFLLEV